MCNITYRTCCCELSSEATPVTASRADWKKSSHLWCQCPFRIYGAPPHTHKTRGLSGPPWPPEADRGSCPRARTLQPPQKTTLLFGTKTSLSLVFAPAEVVQEMAETLPVHLRRWEWGRGQHSTPSHPKSLLVLIKQKKKTSPTNRV